jgi:hypothetical protein
MDRFLQMQGRFGCLSLLLLFVAGCHSQSSPKVDAKAFAQAAPELKRFWDSAQTADQTNNYADAQAFYYTLLRKNLTPEERQAVSAASTALNQRFTKALQAADPGAKAALVQMRANPPNRMH